VGAATGSFAGGLLTDWLGYTYTMWIGAGLTALGGVAALLFLPETRDLRPGDEAAGRPNGSLRANRGLWAVASLYGMNRFVLSGLFGATMALLAQDRLGAFLPIGIATLSGILSAGRTVLSMAAAPLAGTASDRMGGRWPIAAWGAAGAAASMLLVAWGAPAAILAGVALGALAGGSIQTLVTALIGDLVSLEQRGRAIGAVHTAGDLGSAVGPLIAYAVLPWIGLRGVYLFGAGLFALQWIGMQWFRARGRRRVAVASYGHVGVPCSSDEGGDR
jgi:MFS family permease